MFEDAPVQISGPLHLLLSPSPPDCLEDHVPEFGKLGRRVAAFLEVEVRPAIERFDDDLLAAAAGEDDERYNKASPADLL